MANVSQLLNRRLSTPKREEIGIGGFTAVVRVKESYNLSADAPNSTVEDGSYLNDHIILNPLTIEIEGEAGDVHERRSPAVRRATRGRAEIGNLANLYAPGFTSSQLQQIDSIAADARDAVRRIDAVIDGGQQALDYFGNRDAESRSIQERFLDHMDAMHFGRVPVSIDMPYRRCENMVLTNFSTRKTNESEALSFSASFKQINLADLRFVEIERPANGTNGQTDPETDKGAQEGEDVPRSLLQGIVDLF